jgi:UDP-glucose 4-epimerase
METLDDISDTLKSISEKLGRLLAIAEEIRATEVQTPRANTKLSQEEILKDLHQAFKKVGLWRL